MPIRTGLWLYRTLGALVMLLLLTAWATFLSLGVSTWFLLFTRRPVNGASLVLRAGLALGAMVAVAGLMEIRRRLEPGTRERDDC